MAAGSALLAIAGPVGWSVAGAAVLGAAVFLHLRNRRLAEEAEERRVEVEAEIRSFNASERKIKGLAQRTREHADGCVAELVWLTERAPADYRQFKVAQKERLAALINHIRSLGKLLAEQVDSESV